MDEFYSGKFHGTDDLETDDGHDDEGEVERLQEYLKKLKREEKKLLLMGFEKDKKAKRLENQLRELTNSSFSEHNHKQVKDLYKGFDLAEDELKSLRSISAQKKYDATFLRRTIMIFYKENLECLSGKSRVGTKERISKTTKQPITAPKSKLTPAKLNKVTLLFKERVNFCANSYMESLQRKKRMKQLLSESLRYIQKQNESGMYEHKE